MQRGLKSGDPTWVWPKPGLLVQSHAEIHERFLPAEGACLPWSQWLAARVADGSVLLTNPNPKPAATRKEKE